MIVSFSLANCRSFLEEETLSLVASRRLADAHDDHRIAIPGSEESVLKAALVYGANGAGKSNLFKALQYLKTLAIEARDKNAGTGRESFRLSDGTDSEPSSFDLQFITKGRLYRFGIKVDDRKVTEEWLLRIEDGRERTLYERLTDPQGRVVVEIDRMSDADTRLKALATVGGPQNQSFLATIRANLEPTDADEHITDVLGWFSDSLTLIGPDESFAPVGHMLSDNMEFREFAGAFLRAASTGVHHLDVLKREIDEDELHALTPKVLLSKVMRELRDAGEAVVEIGEGGELLIEKGEKNRYYRITVQASHQQAEGRFVPLEIKEESDGTRRLLSLVPVLHRWKTSDDAVFVIDEIDRSMHPILAWKFIEFFLASCRQAGRQLIVTTHESGLLDFDLVRRDEIWFVEKDPNAASKLYSLADFKVRSDLEIRKHYLQGRFGAVPFIGNIDTEMQLGYTDCGRPLSPKRCRLSSPPDCGH